MGQNESTLINVDPSLKSVLFSIGQKFTGLLDYLKRQNKANVFYSPLTKLFNGACMENTDFLLFIFGMYKWLVLKRNHLSDIDALLTN